MVPISLKANQSVPWYNFDSEELLNTPATMHFSPANGIPVMAYQCFLSHFSNNYNVTGMDNRGAWPKQALPKSSFSWQDHADDLIEAIELQYTAPIIGMGHSIGATITALAAVKRPDLFSKLILIDSATLPSKAASMISANMPEWLSFMFFKFIKRTHNRQRIWPSKQAFIDNYRAHPTYRLFTDQAFRDYVEHGLFENEHGQFELTFNPHWESFNFRRVHYLWATLLKTAHPTLLLRAENSYMYSQDQFDKLNSKLPSNINAQTIAGGNHLAPLEIPKESANQINLWL